MILVGLVFLYIFSYTYGKHVKGMVRIIIAEKHSRACGDNNKNNFKRPIPECKSKIIHKEVSVKLCVMTGVKCLMESMMYLVELMKCHITSKNDGC